MMQRILTFDEPQTEPAAESAGPAEEFELVVGRRQIAAMAFLALVMVAVCSGAAYLAGKAMSAGEEAPAPVINLEQAPVPVIEATIAPAPVGTALPAAPARMPEAPLFASSVPQAIYIQVGAVEKGVATVIAEGLRKHALDAFVAPGPSEKIFRVLIGPFRDEAAYRKAQSTVDEIGLANFARRYQQP